MVVFFSRKGINVLLLPVVAIGVVVGVKSVRREGGRVGLVVVVGEVLTTRVVVLFGSMNGMRVRVAVVEGSRDAVGVVTEEVLVRDAVVFPGSLKGSSDVLTVLDIDAVVVVIRGVVAGEMVVKMNGVEDGLKVGSKKGIRETTRVVVRDEEVKTLVVVVNTELLSC